MRKKCIFCQRDNQKITKEHILPNWLSRMYGEDMTCTNESTTEEGKVVYSFQSKIFQQTTNTICAACNNGWMSEIENQAKPILERMLRGKNVVLDKKKQHRIATWAMKTVLVINHNNPAPPKKPMIPISHYENFYMNKQITDRGIVLLGYRPLKTLKDGDRIACSWINVSQHLQVDKKISERDRKLIEESGGSYGSTFCIANIVFQIVNPLIINKAIRFEMLIPDEPERVINPFTTKVRWPLPHSIDEVGGLTVIHEALKGGTPPEHNS